MNANFASKHFRPNLNTELDKLFPAHDYHNYVTQLSRDLIAEIQNEPSKENEQPQTKPEQPQTNSEQSQTNPEEQQNNLPAVDEIPEKASETVSEQ